MKNKIKTYVVTGILLVFSCYLLPVSAQDLSAISISPEIFFDDINEADLEWKLWGDQANFGLYNYDTAYWLILFDDAADMKLEMIASTFRIKDELDNIIVNVHRDAPEIALDIQSNGDVSLAGDSVFIDTSINQLGIGTTAPANDLHIKSNTPAMIFDDTSVNSTDWLVGNIADDFSFFTTNNGTGGPVDTEIMTLDAQTGFVGIRAPHPTALLHVKNSNGTAKILVEETNLVAAPRTLFQLKNKGNTKFGVLNTAANVEWAFANPGTGFRLSRQGSGVVEMEIFNNGNVTIAGALTQNSDVNAKTAFTEINADEILNLVTRLPVSKWEYKDALGESHIGPMAQDFYAAFGLGATDTGISSIDTAGVALAAIQALAEKNTQLETQNLALEQRANESEQRAISMEQRVAELEQQNQRIEKLVREMVSNQTDRVVMN